MKKDKLGLDELPGKKLLAEFSMVDGQLQMDLTEVEYVGNVVECQDCCMAQKLPDGKTVFTLGEKREPLKLPTVFLNMAKPMLGMLGIK